MTADEAFFTCTPFCMVPALRFNGENVGTGQLGPIYSKLMSEWGSQVGVELPFSRTQESEADHVGLILMAKAGYDPHQALDFWKRMAAFSKSRGAAPPGFLGDHPTDEDRIAAIIREMPEAERAYTSAPH